MLDYARMTGKLFPNSIGHINNFWEMIYITTHYFELPTQVLTRGQICPRVNS